MARVCGARFMLVAVVTIMLTLAAGAASAQDEELLPPNLDEDIAPEERTGEGMDAEAEPTKEEASGPKAAGEAPTEEKSGASTKESSSPPTPPLLLRVSRLMVTPRAGTRPPTVLAYPLGLSLLVA